MRLGQAKGIEKIGQPDHKRPNRVDRPMGDTQTEIADNVDGVGAKSLAQRANIGSPHCRTNVETVQQKQRRPIVWPANIDMG